jgi:alpha-L-fucosidase
VPLLLIDGWSWKAGHMSVPFDEIHAHVKSLQPECLLMDLTHMHDLWDADIVMYEEPKGIWAPETNTLPSSQCTTIGPGNGWFWGTQTPGDAMSVTDIVSDHLGYLEPLWVTFILNCPPNREGQMDDIIVERLAEVGELWSPDESRPPLPEQDLQIGHYVTPIGAEATSGDAVNAIDGINDTNYYSVWETDEALPQSITIDLGEVHDGITKLAYVPKYVTPGTPTNEGSITSYRIHVSTDNDTFEEAATGTWEGDEHMKVAAFPPTAARYIRLEALEANGGFAAATEISIGDGKDVL